MSPFLSTTAWPRWAISLVRAGDKDRAEKILSKIPTDCYLCARARGTVALVESQFGRADYWYRRAIADAPRLPAAYFELGALVIKRGRLDEAVSLFGSAQQYGPHFADPLEMWGEALMLKNRSDLALIKFADANKYAPNWGRLHMKWGEALGYVGRKGEARAQYHITSTLDLSVDDQVELARDVRGS